MKVKEIFDLAVKKGIKADPRGEAGVKEYLENVKKEFENCKPKDEKYLDSERLINPYMDSRIHHDNGGDVKRVIAGIDVDEAEILLATQLSERGNKVDLAISHHPIGYGLAHLHSVMDMQVEIFVKAGVPVHVAEKLMEKRISEVSRGVHPINHYRTTDMAKLLDVNLINTHTTADNLVSEFLENHFAKRKPKLVSDMIDCLLEIPEYEEAKKRGAGPSLFTGNPKHHVGKYMVEMTGGTSPNDDIYKELSRAGISTTIGMHMRDDAKKKASKHHMNVLIAGHMASDSLGMNLFLDELEKKGIEVTPCSGLIRISRVNKK